MAGNMVGRVLNDRYEITERVGIGGMAEVYRAQDKVLGRMVAVKVMLPQYAADETFTARFRLEAASAARLQNSRIVTIYDWGLDGETYYIVMEFLRGTDLKTAIQERGAINQRKVAEIGSQVAEALSTAHAADIIHRDIKPQNIMIQPDGNIKVMDFGIARAGDAGLSQTSTVLGTAHYVSPEQAQGKDLGPASDIYSLGIVLYEAATGKLPFEGTDAVSVAVKQVNELPAPPSTINPNIDPALELIIMKALEKDPTKRFANAGQMRQALNDFLAGRPVRVGDVSNMATTVMGSVAGGATTAMPRTYGSNELGATTAMPGRGAQTVTATDYEDEEEERKGGKGKFIAIAVAILAIIAIAAGVFALTSGNKEMVAVPNVAGETLEQAKSDLTDAGFAVGNVNEVYNASVSEGKVVSTNPPSGQKAEKGSAVDINVSKGSESVEVPDVLGMSKEEAIKAIEAKDMVAEVGDDIYSDEYDEGEVAQQSPKGGSRANKGDTITINISKGEDKVEVPSVTGTTEEKAEDALKSAGFRVSKSYKNSDSVAEGKVISQSVSGSAPSGSTVSIVISSGPAEPESDEIDVPNVTGLDQASAENRISKAGLRYAVKTQTVDTISKDGLVINQNKTGKAQKGDTVTITVGKYEE